MHLNLATHASRLGDSGKSACLIPKWRLGGTPGVCLGTDGFFKERDETAHEYLLRATMRRVVITGVGPITSIGIGKEKFWAAIKEKRSGIGPVSRFDPSIFKATSAGEVLHWEPEEYFPPHRLTRLDRYAKFAVASVKLALRASG